MFNKMINPYASKLKMMHRDKRFSQITKNTVAKKIKFSIKDFFSKCEKYEDILGEKLHFLCTEISNKRKVNYENLSK